MPIYVLTHFLRVNLCVSCAVITLLSPGTHDTFLYSQISVPLQPFINSFTHNSFVWCKYLKNKCPAQLHFLHCNIKNVFLSVFLHSI